MTAPAYQYAASVLSVHDGDTCHLDIDLGFSTHVHADIRIAHINAAELATAQGPPARDHLTTLLGSGPVTVKVLGADKYGGRWLGEITAGAVNVNARMVADGFAASYEGHGTKPVPPAPPPS